MEEPLHWARRVVDQVAYLWEDLSELAVNVVPPNRILRNWK